MTRSDTLQNVNRIALSTADVSSSLRHALQLVEATMRAAVDSDVTTLRDASHHILEAGGKRIRPRLVLLSYAAVGGADMREAANVAAAIELMHTASVVHDDINDHGIVRRGRPSVNAIWGRTFALLTGDYLFTKVYELMAPYGDLNIALAEAAVALVEGETLQASAVKENRFTREVYLDIIGRKTAALFRASGSMGALLAGADRETSETLGAFGYNIGLAFQIVDDILDLTSDTDKIGKTAGIDLAQGKGYAAVERDGDLISAAVGNNSADPMAKIKAKVMQGNYVNEGREQAQMLMHAAIAHLDILPDSDARDELIALARSVVEREF